MKRTLSFVIKSFLGLLCLGVAFLFIQSQQQSQQTPNLFGYSALTILSNSMQPEFSEGDVIVIQQTSSSDLATNDIITFGTKDGNRVTHRITDTMDQDQNRFFTTKGDNNNVADAEPVFEGQVIGKVLFSIPKLGFVARFLSEPIGFMLLIVLPLVAYVGITVYERLSKPTKKEEAFK
ncbi:signal peptidase I [Alkalicoccobacillus plakortidis]|uniref:Signal peptidase I n=1 Tax=Alkalicoccobacillus plakortidis TaxID=444060 RepID=A0ABT0XMN5_9BACI|nr:signal peptidase I [Alkalicoccobacillus plakortidis]MCM2677169.1 signal peptidase I [Alkalicoccobacillus plakortidis]